MSNMIMNVEFIGGTSIEAAIDDARDKAIMFNVAYVQFNFNGSSICVGKQCDVNNSVEYWLNNPNEKHFVFN